MIVSQERARIGVTFGKKTTRSGGKALDFYASQIVWLSHVETIKESKGKITRPTGIRVRAKVEKNKCGLPFRESEFEIAFGFGVDSLRSGIEWLDEVGKLDRTGLAWKEAARLIRDLNQGKVDRNRADEVTKLVDDAVRTVWSEIETSFLPKRGPKYGQGIESER
jgi:RecA/RadA recombinase